EEDGIRDRNVTGVQTCALPISIFPYLEKYASLVPMFEDMEKLAAILRSKRMGRGAIDFDFKEAEVLVDDGGKAIDVVLRERSVRSEERRVGKGGDGRCGGEAQE